ncbi:metallophosphoesterase [Proteiniclasticum sp. SCR006]|uniref:Metallophosphoesterase n=1 Tax=Proteiniclasticum aestuarii TaxID=2817862 RepID=A0A939H5P5_9CLOT|nr:DNA repair exonuclease [Proteiniclasticum aestuarii]MBO1264707.1 metallophosphoesterase [Proteiniclasticum aestuarii]
MNEIRLMHVADVHLGSEVATVPEKQEARKKELLRTFRRITQLCKEEKMDLLLIAGDLFEGANVDPQIAASVKTYLAEVPARVFISPGNHDYVAMDSPYAEEDWPDNVTIFRGKMERVVLPDLKTAVYGAGFESTYVRRSLFDPKLPVEREYLNLCVVHGDLVSENQESDYHGITPSVLSGSGMDYVALGHIHLRSSIEKAGSTWYAYPGCPEGRGFDELGEKGVYMGTISREKMDLQFRPLSQRMYLVEEMDLSEVQNEIEAEKKILALLKERYRESFEKHFYRIRVKGTMNRDQKIPWKNVELALKEELYFVKLVDETRMAVDYEEMAREKSLRGYFVQELLLQRKEAEKSGDEKALTRIDKALDYGMKAFEGQVGLGDY